MRDRVCGAPMIYYDLVVLIRRIWIKDDLAPFDGIPLAKSGSRSVSNQGFALYIAAHPVLECDQEDVPNGSASVGLDLDERANLQTSNRLTKRLDSTKSVLGLGNGVVLTTEDDQSLLWLLCRSRLCRLS